VAAKACKGGPAEARRAAPSNFPRARLISHSRASNFHLLGLYYQNATAEGPKADSPALAAARCNHRSS